MAEETKAKPKKEEEVKTVVVAQLPTQEYNIVQDKDGNDIKLNTIEQALTEILSIAKELKKGLL